MTVTSACLFCVFGVYALGNWWAVETENKRLEYLCKPTALAALTWAAMALDPADSAVRTAFVVGLVLSLAGDVFLMLPGELFVYGLASFLAAHIAYIVGFVIDGQEPGLLVLGLVVVAIGVAVVGRRLVAAVRGGSTPEATGPIIAYMAVISAMVATAFGSGNPVAIAGALTFYASDSLLGWNRFAQPFPHAHLAVMVTYHLGQLLLVLSLI